ncbi:hypothetical protein [Bacillus xiapuensis]|uniref:Phage protein n=1 Tax=Bacillus xiapuensis TaxID=2014075 RepID=A0ABU6NC55_9BACI|nr:hypothetical protein [Bacillus xiapuensis]
MNKIQVKLVPSTACLMIKNGPELMDYKFYNRFDFETLDQEQINKDTTLMVNKQLKALILLMLNEYRGKNSFSKPNLETILQLADFTELEISRLINKFHYINTRIADNGGIPILKDILSILERKGTN